MIFPIALHHLLPFLAKTLLKGWPHDNLFRDIVSNQSPDDFIANSENRGFEFSFGWRRRLCREFGESLEGVSEALSTAVDGCVISFED
jgi:hypothetical protein